MSEENSDFQKSGKFIIDISKNTLTDFSQFSGSFLLIKKKTEAFHRFGHSVVITNRFYLPTVKTVPLIFDFNVTVDDIITRMLCAGRTSMVR